MGNQYHAFQIQYLSLNVNLNTISDKVTTDTRILSSAIDSYSRNAITGLILHQMAEHSPVADESWWSIHEDLLSLRGILHKDERY